MSSTVEVTNLDRTEAIQEGGRHDNMGGTVLDARTPCLATLRRAERITKQATQARRRPRNLRTRTRHRQAHRTRTAQERASKKDQEHQGYKEPKHGDTR